MQNKVRQSIAQKCKIRYLLVLFALILVSANQFSTNTVKAWWENPSDVILVNSETGTRKCSPVQEYINADSDPDNWCATVSVEHYHIDYDGTTVQDFLNVAPIIEVTIDPDVDYSADQSLLKQMSYVIDHVRLQWKVWDYRSGSYLADTKLVWGHDGLVPLNVMQKPDYEYDEEIHGEQTDAMAKYLLDCLQNFLTTVEEKPDFFARMGSVIPYLGIIFALAPSEQQSLETQDSETGSDYWVKYDTPTYLGPNSGEERYFSLTMQPQFTICLNQHDTDYRFELDWEVGFSESWVQDTPNSVFDYWEEPGFSVHGDYEFYFHYDMDGSQFNDPEKEDSDLDGIYEPDDPDDDNDGIEDWYEELYPSVLNPEDPTDADDDPDNDGLTNLEEFEYGTSPNDPDIASASVDEASSGVARLTGDTRVYSYLDFDVTAPGSLKFNAYARYKSWEQETFDEDFELKYSKTDNYLPGHYHLWELYVDPDPDEPPIDPLENAVIVWNLANWHEFCTIEVKWELHSIAQTVDTYIATYEWNPYANILSDSTRTQLYDYSYTHQGARLKMRFEIGTAGVYTFRTQYIANAAEGTITKDTTVFKPVGSYPALEYEISVDTHRYYSVGTKIGVKWSILANGIEIASCTPALLTLIAPCEIDPDSWVEQEYDAAGDAALSHMQIYLRAAGNYYIKVRYQEVGATSWTTAYSGTKSLSTGTQTVSTYLFTITQTALYNIEWSIYDISGNLYDSLTEQFAAYERPPVDPKPPPV